MADTQTAEGRRAEAGTRSGTVKPGQRANAADRHVGARIRERTYQQAHKYERGLNRISAGRLFEIAQVLGVAVSWFFEGLTAEAEPNEVSPRQRMCLELARNFALIDNEKHQEALSQMARALAAQSQAAVAAPVVATSLAEPGEAH